MPCCAVQVPRGHVWLQGDNLILSRDSREYGPVPLALVKGRVIAQVRQHGMRTLQDGNFGSTLPRCKHSSNLETSKQKHSNLHARLRI
jgi:hypothetical protein